MKKRISNKNRRTLPRHFPPNGGLNRFISRDFSIIEDNARAFELIQKLAKNAGKYAAAEARARGLGTVYVFDNRLVRVFAKGEPVVVAPKIKRESFYVKYKPATILHAIKK